MNPGVYIVITRTVGASGTKYPWMVSLQDSTYTEATKFVTMLTNEFHNMTWKIVKVSDE